MDSTRRAGAGRPEVGARYGIAIDLGTSSVWSRLVDLDDARVVDTMVFPNPQRKHGADIASRLGLAAGSPELRAALHRQAVGAVGDSIGQLCRDAGITDADIAEVACVGNSAMYAFLLDLDPEPLCGTPYNLKGARDFFGSANDLDAALPDVNLFVPRPIFGFVGSDALADILLIGMSGSEAPELIVDVGTNCEMALGNRERVLVASSPAGPAYEDSHMSFGQSASAGAIYKARLAGSGFDFEVVGGGEPRGICGSGLIDIIAELRRHGRVDASGRLLEEGPVVIAGGDQPITISQHDIRSFQLVKASVHAAISVLRQKLGTEALSRMLITGTFGSYINLENARQLNMFPDLPDDRVEVVGDAACQGAVMMLGSRSHAALEEIRGRTRHVALPLNRFFQEEFVRLMAI